VMTFAIKKRINTTAKNKAALACLNEYYDFKAFTRVSWPFTTKICPIGMRIGVPHVSRDKTGKLRVDTLESWHTVCLIFGSD